MTPVPNASILRYSTMSSTVSVGGSRRPFQEQAIRPILAGEHILYLAPTAGGKTEAALLASPVPDALRELDWPECPLYLPHQALLNDLDVRLRRYTSLLGRRSGPAGMATSGRAMPYRGRSTRLPTDHAGVP